MDKAWTSAKHLPTPCPHSPPSRPPPHRFNNNDSSQRQLHRHRNLPGLFRHPRQSVDGIVRSNTVRFQRNKVTNNSRSPRRTRRWSSRNLGYLVFSTVERRRGRRGRSGPGPRGIVRPRLRSVQAAGGSEGLAWGWGSGRKSRNLGDLVFSTVERRRAVEVVQAHGESSGGSEGGRSGGSAERRKRSEARGEARSRSRLIGTDEVGELTPEDPAEGKRPTG